MEDLPWGKVVYTFAVGEKVEMGVTRFRTCKTTGLKLQTASHMTPLGNLPPGLQKVVYKFAQALKKSL